MKIGPYVEKLNNSSEFKSFAKKNEDAFMVAGFFVLDFENGKNMHQIDYYVPSKKKIAAFTLDKKVELQLLDMLNHKVPGQLDMKTKTDLDELKGILTDEMKNRSITQEIKKIIAIIQNVEGKKIWNLSCVLSGMDILKAHVEDDSQTVLKMEKSSILDYIQKVPGGMQMPGQQQPGQAGPQVQVQQQQPTISNEEKMKRLQQLQAEIEKEKTQLQKEMSTPKEATPTKAAKTAKVKSKK